MRIKLDELMASQSVFDRNEARGCPDGQEPCLICGKASKPVNFVHVVKHGDTITDEIFEADDSVGWHVVGPCCFKKVKKAFGGRYPTVNVVVF